MSSHNKGKDHDIKQLINYPDGTNVGSTMNLGEVHEETCFGQK